MACHHRLWAAHTVERHRVWHAIIALGWHTRSDDVRRDMSSPPLDSTHGRTTSGVAFHLCLWAAHTVKRRCAWHDIIAVAQHTRSKDIRRGMTSPPLECTHGRTTSGVACYHRPWTAHTVGNIERGMTSPPLHCTHGQQRRAWHDFTALRQYTLSDDVRSGMTSPPLGSTDGQTTSGLA